MLKKRAFLKSCIVILGFLFVAPMKLLAIVKPKSQPEGKFDLSEEHGRSFTYFGDFDNYKIQIEFMKQQANMMLPPNVKYELRVLFPTYYGRVRGIAYYYHFSFQNEPLETLNEINVKDFRNGYYYLGRYKTGA